MCVCVYITEFAKLCDIGKQDTSETVSESRKWSSSWILPISLEKYVLILTANLLKRHRSHFTQNERKHEWFPLCYCRSINANILTAKAKLALFTISERGEGYDIPPYSNKHLSRLSSVWKPTKFRGLERQKYTLAYSGAKGPTHWERTTYCCTDSSFQFQGHKPTSRNLPGNSSSAIFRGVAEN